VLFVTIESIVARLVTPADSRVRTAWSLSQLAIGVTALVGCHVFNFLVLAAEDADFGLLDLLMKPLKLWARAIQNLPTRLWVTNAAASGLAAAVLSVLVIGGIPYDRLWDWGFKQPPKQDLMGAVMDRVRKLDNGKESGDLEKAVSDFAGSKGDEPKDKSNAAPPKPRENADCVILGYLLDRDGRIVTLLLGIADRGKLIYAGNVAPKLADHEMKSLVESLKSIETKRPIIQIGSEATWVRPKYTCRISFGERTKGGRLRDIEWNKLLGSIEKR
jgi:ATP dependent DNA ligase C terminal region